MTKMLSTDNDHSSRYPVTNCTTASAPDTTPAPGSKLSQRCSYRPYTAAVNDSATQTQIIVQNSAWRTDISVASRCRTLRSSTSSVRNSARKASQTSSL